MADPSASIQLIRGFHQIEHESWRWTAGKFSVTLKTPSGGAQKGGRLTFRFSLPDAVMARVGSTTLTASVDGSAVKSMTYTRAGEYAFEADIPAAALRSEACTADFALDNYLPAGTADERELGLVASQIILESK
jgi:hypothetical protein